MTALSPKWTKSIRTAALRTRTFRRITLALHRSNSAVRRRRWLRHHTADAGPLRYPVNGLLSGLCCSGVAWRLLVCYLLVCYSPCVSPPFPGVQS